MSDAPLTLGTAGHVDHGKTQLVRALTGVDTDRLEEERRRGISIVLGYAPLCLPSGRTISVVDVPGHERLVRTMVAGATGIDFYLMVVAADDGVMPQTREHAAVLRALDLETGVVAVTKSDAADPTGSAAEALELLPDADVVICSARSGEGLEVLRSTLDRAAARVPSRAVASRPAVLHVDRVFTIDGAGTVATGTLWAGMIAAGDRVDILPEGFQARVRGVQVHNQARDVAEAGQRVAVNLAGVRRERLRRGHVLAAPGAALRASTVLDCELQLAARVSPRTRVHVHHGTRESPGRVIDLGDGLWQLRLEHPLIAAVGDRVVVRSAAPADTLGGGTILDAAAHRHGSRSPATDRLHRARRGLPDTPPPREAVSLAASPPPLTPAALALEQLLRSAGHEPPLDSELDPGDLGLLRAHGRAVRLGSTMHAHPCVVDAVRARVERIIAADGTITLARLRDELGTSRKYAQALLEHLDAAHVTLRRPDDSRVLRRSRAPRT